MSEHGWLDELFEAEEARHPVPTGLRRSVVSSVTSTGVPERRPSAMLALTAAALVVVVVGSLIAIGRLAHPTGSLPAHPASPSASPAPAASPSPAGEPDYGPVPAGIAVVYAVDSRQPSWLIAYDAAGKPVGTVKLPAGIEAGSASIGGDLIFAAGSVYDRTGRALGPFAAGKGRPVVADDQRHVCAVNLDQNTYVNTLTTQLIAQPSRTVAVINREQGIGQTGDQVILCSFAHDVAVVVRTAIAWPTDAWLVRLSTGAIFRHLTFPTQAYASIVASPDGAYLAENPSGSTAGQRLRVVRSSDGSVVASLGAEFAYAFAGDTKLITTADYSLPTSKPVSCVDWATGRTVWTYPAGVSIEYLEPLSSAWVAWAPDRAIFVAADGTQTELGGVTLQPVPAF